MINNRHKLTPSALYLCGFGVGLFIIPKDTVKQ